MSLLLSRRLLMRLSGLGKPAAASVRSPLRRIILSNGFSSSSSLLQQTPPYYTTIDGFDCGTGLVVIKIKDALQRGLFTDLKKKVTPEFAHEDILVGSSHGWVATLNEDGILRLQDDLIPLASETDPKRIPLPPLVTLPLCQTQLVTNMAMSSPSPEEDEDCVVAIKFDGPQLSFCRPAQSNPQWTNIRIENPCFFSSRVMYSEKDDMFRILGSGGHLIGSWDPRTPENKPRFQKIRYQICPELTKSKRELLFSSYMTDHLVESRPTGEDFLVKVYRKACSRGYTKLKTKAVMVFKLDAQGNAVYTSDIGDLRIFLSRSEPFCVLDTDNYFPNRVDVWDFDEKAFADLEDTSIYSNNFLYSAPFFIPPQKKKLVG